MLAYMGDNVIKGSNAAPLLAFLGMLSLKLLQQLQVALQLKIFKFIQDSPSLIYRAAIADDLTDPAA